jgi:hypothetical protein
VFQKEATSLVRRLERLNWLERVCCRRKGKKRENRIYALLFNSILFSSCLLFCLFGKSYLFELLGNDLCLSNLFRLDVSVYLVHFERCNISLALVRTLAFELITSKSARRRRGQNQQLSNKQKQKKLT